MNVLGIDQATSCGFALLSAGQVLQAGAWDLSIRTKASKTIDADPPALRLAKLHGSLSQLLKDHKVDLIAYEKVTAGKRVGGPAGDLSRHLEAVILIVGFYRKIPTVNFAAGTIKKHATGDGSWKTEKQHMVAAACKRWPGFMARFNPDEFPAIDDMVDAMWIADLAGKHHDHEWP